MENYISTEVNPFANAALTGKERVFWNAMVVLLQKKFERSRDPEIERCVEEMKTYINGQVEFNFEELDNFELGESRHLEERLTKYSRKNFRRSTET